MHKNKKILYSDHVFDCIIFQKFMIIYLKITVSDSLFNFTYFK